jgi:hypothetical protein
MRAKGVAHGMYRSPLDLRLLQILINQILNGSRFDGRLEPGYEEAVVVNRRPGLQPGFEGLNRGPRPGFR